MWTRTRTETFFKRAADEAEDAFKDVGGSINQAFHGIEDSLQRFRMRQPNWFHSGGNGVTNAFGQSPGRASSGEFGLPEGMQPADQTTASRSSGSSSTGSPAPQPASTPQPAASRAPTSGYPAPQSARASARAASAPMVMQPVQDGVDDAMRRHCASLERLVVDLGISPHAARVALRHLDAWLVSQAGAMEMAAAEAAAHGTGEPILHVGDPVRLEGLVKNKNLNGATGTLQCYGADSQRWKVALPNGEVFWVKPKLVKPLEPRRLPLPEAGVQGQPGAAEEALEKRDEEQATALAAGWAVLEARQERMKAEFESREIMLLEREESLRKAHEALEAEQEQLGEVRHLMAVQQAQGMAEIERHLASARDGGAGFGTAAFSMNDDIDDSHGHDETDEMELVSTAEGAVRTMEEGEAEGEEEADEMWDMDWSKLGGGGQAAQKEVGSAAGLRIGGQSLNATMGRQVS